MERWTAIACLIAALACGCAETETDPDAIRRPSLLKTAEGQPAECGWWPWQPDALADTCADDTICVMASLGVGGVCDTPYRRPYTISVVQMGARPGSRHDLAFAISVDGKRRYRSRVTRYNDSVRYNEENLPGVRDVVITPDTQIEIEMLDVDRDGEQVLMRCGVHELTPALLRQRWLRCEQDEGEIHALITMEPLLSR